MEEIAYARKISDFIESLPEFKWLEQNYKTYKHMGATLADAGLQAGLNYRTVVAPRIYRLIKNWPNAKTTQGFLTEQKKWGLKEMLNWSHPAKIHRVYNITVLLSDHQVETERELCKWLEHRENHDKLLGIQGIGQKTVDYLWRLVGGQAIAIDRHLKRFALWAGIHIKEYSELEKIFRCTADFIGVSYNSFDRTIWAYVSNTRRSNNY